MTASLWSWNRPRISTRFMESPQGQRRLILERRRPTKDQKLVAQAHKAALAKARELGWIL